MPKKYTYIQLEERNGEYEYTFRMVRELKKGESPARRAEQEAKNWYGSDRQKSDGGYYFNGGEVFVSVDHYRLISKEDYEVLTRYL